MIKSPSPSSPTEPRRAPWWQRLGWMLIIWCGSVLALLAVSMLFRMMMTAAGMKSH
ncbi:MULTISPECIES: DUF2474 domain-containing protein [Yersinia]|uniref:DUF2474 domain-containing protein n=2 Tax=Yersinia bercovieri TaxID=634 RepID=A0A2G4TZI2_YERBE|nr:MULTISPECIES: DUF2474 domain-containing protein [Yersinia]EEQ07815.1 hypothetical protein yberc0001_23400 [Yersinia bercovieri ATCC 43970]MCB5301109.1 DUF2474 domain-containing protein [Yersinia bercovieri]PHZ26461.1 DUF2474 domain-containing protein [Yersinia bercovieri]QDW33191.1 DUF2474 domain-containing protein [Yersinia sp. KBS0713]QKJ08462.1 DUF2474 domain-containing protein [Yersinia bercovieri ATCC 43970]